MTFIEDKRGQYIQIIMAIGAVLVIILALTIAKITGKIL
jgi:hypothetical protein